MVLTPAQVGDEKKRSKTEAEKSNRIL